MKNLHIWALSIAYPIVLAFFIWLFFLSEELLSTSDILSGMFVVGVFGLLGGMLLFGIIEDRAKSPKIQTLLNAILWIQIVVFGLMTAVPILSILLVPVCIAIYHMCILFPVSCIIGGVLLFVVICVTVYIKFGLKKGLLHYPVLRTIYYRLSQILPVYVCVISIFFIPHVFEMESDIPGYGVSSLITICIVTLSFIFGDNGEKVYYMTIPHLKYNFFLRPFSMDDSLKIDEEIKNNFTECELIEIADPITKQGNANFTGKSFFLPTKDWKRELSYYIKRAQLVFCCVGTSDGVKWEMFEHDTILDKYIFYYGSSISIKEILQDIRLTKHTHSKVHSLLKSMQKHSLVGPLYFVIRRNDCYYSTELSSIASFIKEEKRTDQLYSFEFEYHKKENVERINTWKTNMVYYFKDLGRVFSLVIRPNSLFNLLKVLVCIVLALLSLLGFLLGIAWIINGIVSLVSFLLPSFQQEILFSMEGIVETPRQLLFFSIGEIVTGIAFLRMILKKY